MKHWGRLVIIKCFYSGHCAQPMRYFLSSLNEWGTERLIYLLRVTQEVTESGFELRHLLPHPNLLTTMVSWVSHSYHIRGLGWMFLWGRPCISPLLWLYSNQFPFLEGFYYLSNSRDSVYLLGNFPCSPLRRATLFILVTSGLFVAPSWQSHLGLWWRPRAGMERAKPLDSNQLELTSQGVARLWYLILILRNW